MHPILIRIGPFTIYSYGAMVALGFALAIAFIYRFAPRFNIDRKRMMDLAILILISGIIGARLFYILLNLNHYVANPLEIANLSRGGLVWYGGFISALVCALLYIKANNLNFWAVADLLAPYLALAQAVGRIGCFLNGCCYGIRMRPGSAFPTQIFSAITLFVIFAILSIWQKARHYAGEIFLGYCMLYSFKRYLIEFLRGDNSKIFMGLTISQVISIAVLSGSVILFLVKSIEWKKRLSNLR